MLRTLALVILAGVSAAAAEPVVTCRLELPTVAADVPEGYQRAVLTVTHDLPVPIAAAALRADGGGPWLLTRLTAPPGHATRKAVRLPATSIEQTYTIRLFAVAPAVGADLPEPVAEARASIRWPADQVDTWRWINPTAHEIFAEGAPGWSVELRQQVLIALAAITIGAGFALLARHPAVRASLAALIAVAAAAAMVWMMLAVAPPRVSVGSLHLVQREGGGRTQLETFTIVAARRTAPATVRRSTPAWCMYPDRARMRADQAILTRAGRSLSSGTVLAARMGAGEVRILASRGLAPEDMPRPGRITFDVDAEADQWIVRPSRATPSSVLVMDGRVVPVGAMARRTPRRVDRSAAESIHALYRDGQRFGFDADALKLLRWWNQTRRRPDQVYLVWASRLPDGPALYAVAVESSDG